MYAVIETGGKQYRVELGTEVAVERLEADPGDTISFDRVLLVADGDTAQIGTPVVSEAVVTASVLRQDRGEKVIVFKYRPKARHRSKKGHRQEQTVVRISDIRLDGRSAADEASASEKQESKARKAAAAEAERKATADQALAAKLAEQAAAKTEEAAAAKPARSATKSKTAPAAKADAAPEDETATPAKPARRKPAARTAPAETEPTPTADAAVAKPKTRRTTTKKDE